MKAIAVIPGRQDSVWLNDVPEPEVPERGWEHWVRFAPVLVGVDEEDRAIIGGKEGRPPKGDQYLIVGHECLGRVEAVGPAVTSLSSGDYVVPTVLRRGSSRHDALGRQDLTTDPDRPARGIAGQHGFMCERVVDDEANLVKVPPDMDPMAVLLEPMAAVEKGLRIAYQAQERLLIFEPQRALVTGTGATSLLATLLLRLRGMNVTVVDRVPLSADDWPRAPLVECLGATCVHVDAGQPLTAALEAPAFDIAFDGMGESDVAFAIPLLLAANGISIHASITDGRQRHLICTDEIIRRVWERQLLMFGTYGAHREDFVRGVEDLKSATQRWPGWLQRLLTHPVEGLDNYQRMVELLLTYAPAIKVFVRV